MSEIVEDTAALRPELNTINWQFLPFDKLKNRELYELLQLRSEIFVVEQTCIFQDMDGADLDAMHLLGMQDGQIVAYARCFDAGHKFAEASIGRLVTRNTLRGKGVGHLLVQKSIDAVISYWGQQPIRIGAQQRLERFYEQHGFCRTGVPYSEDGIAHIEMLRMA